MQCLHRRRLLMPALPLLRLCRLPPAMRLCHGTASCGHSQLVWLQAALLLSTCAVAPAAARRQADRALRQVPELASVVTCIAGLAEAISPCAEMQPAPGNACCSAVQAALDGCGSALELARAVDAETVDAL